MEGTKKKSPTPSSALPIAISTPDVNGVVMSVLAGELVLVGMLVPKELVVLVAKRLLV